MSLPIWLIQSVATTLASSLLLPASLGGTFWGWVPVVAASQVVVGVWLLIAKTVFVGQATIGQRPIAASIILLTSGLIFNQFITSVSQFFEIYEPIDDVGFRFPVSAISFAGWSFIVSLARGEQLRVGDLLGSLSTQLALEKELGTSSLIRLEHFRARVALEIQTTLNLAFEKMPGPRAETNRANALHDLIDEVIKPLGRKLALREPDEAQIQFGYPEAHASKRNVLQLLKLIPRVSPFNPLASAILISVVGFLAKSAVEGYFTAIVLVAMSSSVIFLGSFAARQLQSWLKPKLSDAAWAPIYLAITTAISLADALTTAMFFGWSEDSLGLLLGLALASFVMQVSVAAVIGSRIEQASVLTELEQAIKRVTWMNARLNQLTWVEKSRLAKLVHGDIQARIMATALSIDLNKTDDSNSKHLIESLRADCDAALFQPIQKSSLPAFISSLTKIWRASVQIDSDISDEALQILESDAAAADSVAEIIREGVNNAVRHGGADKIWINAKLQVFGDDGQALDVGLLSLIIGNNGRVPLGHESEPGLGSELLNQLTLKWSLKNSANGAVLQADVPLRAAGQTELVG